MILSTDIQPDAKFRLPCGTVFIIEKVQPYGCFDMAVTSHTEGGKYSAYRNELQDAVDFFNENNAIKL